MLVGCSSWTASISPSSTRSLLSRINVRNPSLALVRSSRPVFASSPRHSSTKPPSDPTTSNASPSSSSSSGPAPDELDLPSSSSSSSSSSLDATGSSSASSKAAGEGGGGVPAESAPSYPSFASISSSLSPRYPDPTLPPIPQGVRKFQPLLTTLPLKSTDIYLAPTLDPEIQPAPHLPPAHPYYFLSIRDSLLPNRFRNNPIPPYPRPIVVPLYPLPVLQPTDPRPADAPSTIRYQALQPEQMAQLYDKRITRRARKDRQFNNWLQTMMDNWDREPDDPEGWQGVRMKLGLPPHARNRPPSLLYQWEALEEEDLWKLVMPLFYLTFSVPILGTFCMWGYDVVFNGRWEDEDGNFRFR